MPQSSVTILTSRMSIPDELTTPALLLDVDRMQHNIDRMQQRLGALGVPLRPHVKTCKSIEIGRRMLGPDSPGITVSSLAEAEQFLEAGIVDQIYAVGIGPGKLEAVANLMARGAKLAIVLDHGDAAGAVADAARANECRYRVLLEIDADGKRAGLGPSDPALIELARIVTAAGCELAGVLTHMGGSYGCRGEQALIEAAETERRAAVIAAERLRRAGHACPIVSVGSTPTAAFARNLNGVTEVRAGTHVFMDRVMAGLGVCTEDDIAISVLTEVIGYRASAGEWLIDAGWTALTADPGLGGSDFGYGRVCDAAGVPLDGLVVRATNQEHGIIAAADGPAPGHPAEPRLRHRRPVRSLPADRRQVFER
jgi:D-serine deaminase-like pyridoxal phosphate-dependent protein